MKLTKLLCIAGLHCFIVMYYCFLRAKSDLQLFSAKGYDWAQATSSQGKEGVWGF